MARIDEPIVMTDAVIREIAQEIYRKFQLVSDNISIHVDTHGVMIYVHANLQPFVMPQGPRDVRLTPNHVFLQPPQH